MPESKYDKIITSQIKQQIIDDYVNEQLSLRDLMAKYNIKSHSYVQKLLEGHVRSASEAGKIAHKRKAANFKLSEKTKEKIRQARLKYMKEHPEDTAWRKRNKPSYPEQCFINFLQEKEIDKKFLIEREYSVFPFYVDFAFVDIKLAIEIDGSQHLQEDRKKKDEEKDQLLRSQGWSVIRFSESIVKTDWDLLYTTISPYLEGKVGFEKVGILKSPKVREKVKRDANGKTEKEIQRAFNARKVKERPSKDELLELIKTKSFAEIGRTYNVCDTTIKSWCKDYEIPSTKRELGLRDGTTIPIKRCIICQTEFKPKERDGKCCSRKCLYKWQSWRSFLDENLNPIIPIEEIRTSWNTYKSKARLMRDFNLSRKQIEAIIEYYKL